MNISKVFIWFYTKRKKKKKNRKKKEDEKKKNKCVDFKLYTKKFTLLGTVYRFRLVRIETYFGDS